MIPSREEGYHLLSMDHPPQQPVKYQNRQQSWHRRSQYSDSPFQHQDQLDQLGCLQQASIPRSFPDIEVKSEDCSNLYGVSRTIDVYGFTPVEGFGPYHDPRGPTRQGYFDPRISTQPTTPLHPFYANYYYSMDGEHGHIPSEDLGKTPLPVTNTYDQYQQEMVNWNSSTGFRQQRSLGAVLAPLRCEPGIHLPEDRDVDVGSGNTTLSGSYRQNLVPPSMSYDDRNNNVVVTASSSSSSSLSLTASNIYERSEATSSVMSSMTSSSHILRTDVVKAEIRKITLASSTSRDKTRTREKYRSVYTTRQRLDLETEFGRGSFIDARRKTDIAGAVGLTERQVKIWFQNRRAKDRKTRRKAASATTKTREGHDSECVSTGRAFPVKTSSMLSTANGMVTDCGATYEHQPIYDNDYY